MKRLACIALALTCGCGGPAPVPTVATITISPSPATVIAGGTTDLTAQAKDSKGAPVAGTITWSTANPFIATVSPTGHVVGMNAGATTITASQGGKSSSAAVTVTPGALEVRGVWAGFEHVGATSGYYNGDVIKTFDSIAPQLSAQMDLMVQMGVNTITFPIGATDATATGMVGPPDCNVPPLAGALWPQPTSAELDGLKKVLDLAQSKGLHVLLNLQDTHFDESPPTNTTTWLTALISDVKDHPALELVTFMGDVHVNDFGGVMSCGLSGEPPLWLGPSGVVYDFLKFELTLARSLGLDPHKISAEAIVGDYNLELGAMSTAPMHLYSPIAVLKQLFDDLSWPANQRTYALSFYFRNKCDVTTPCTEIGPAAWADATAQYVASVVDFTAGSRAIAVEWGTFIGGGSTPDAAVPGITSVMEKYGISGGAYWIWVDTDNTYEASLPFAEGVLKRGSTIQFNPVHDSLVSAYASP
jgi:hypothetical protein